MAQWGWMVRQVRRWLSGVGMVRQVRRWLSGVGRYVGGSVGLDGDVGLLVCVCVCGGGGGGGGGA